MEQQSFQSMVDRYKEDMLRMARSGAGKNPAARQTLAQQPVQQNEQPAEPEPQPMTPAPQMEEPSAPPPAVSRGDGQLTDPERQSASQMANDAPEVLDQSVPEPMTYQEFLRRNRSVGELKIEASLGQGAVPIEGVRITVYKRFTDGPRRFYTLWTDSSGMVNGILLPAPDRSLSERPSNQRPYAVYEVSAEHPDFERMVFPQTPVFPGITSIQKVRLVPSSAAQQQNQ